MDIRQQIISQGIKKNKNAGIIDQTLKNYGQKGLTLVEFNQISPIQNLGKDFLHNVGEGIAGLKTITGGIAKSAIEGTLPQDAYNLATDPEFWKQAGESIAVPYGGWGKQSPWTRLQAIKEHPFDVGLDVLSFGGAGLAKKAGSSIANSAKLSKALEGKPLLQSIKRAVAPTAKERGLNKSILEAKVTSRIDQSGIQKKINEFERLSLNKKFDREQVARNVVYGLRDGSEATVKASNVYKSIIDDMTKQAEDLDLLQKGLTEKNTIAQYLTQSFKELNHADSMGIVDDVISGKTDIPIEYKNAYDVAKQRYDEGLMGYISQALESTKGHGHDVNKGSGYFETARVSGKTTPEQLAPKLEDTTNFILEQIRKNKLGEAGSKYVFDNLSEEITPDIIKSYKEGTLSKDLVAVNKKELLATIKKTFAGTDTRRLERTISEADDWHDVIKQFDKNGKVPKGVYLIDKNHLKMVGNSVEVMKRNKFNSMMKKALLSLPKWVVENRFSNWWNNMMAGVTMADYADAIKLFDTAPLHLDELTSYSGFTGETVARTAIRQAMVKAAARAKKAAKTNDWMGLLDATNELFAAPITRSEAVFEKVDRFANFLHHLKKEAKAKGLNWQDLLEKSKSDDTLFWQIYRNVDRELGDYLGRNLAVPNKVYEQLSWIYPFWKFPAQTARVATNQLIDHPFKSQLLLHQPGRIGYGEWEDIRDELKLAKDDLTGGVPFLEGNRRKGLPSKLMTLGGNQYEALYKLLSQAAGTEGSSTMAGFSPLFSIANRLSDVRDPYGNLAPLEGTYVYNQRRLSEDDHQEYDVTAGDRVKFALRELANTFLVPYRQANYVARPAAYTAIKRDMYTPYADVLNPFQEGNPYGVPRVMGTDKFGSQFGVQTQTAYPPYNKMKAIARKNKKKAKMKYRRKYNIKQRGED